MKVHHLNCGTMRVPTAPVVSHVLLIETGNGLVLVDSGYGLGDIADPARRLGPVRFLLRPALDPAETAARQIERLGFGREDVRHIVLTHLDLDHTGGLSDFPHAQVHLTTAEAAGAIRSPSRREKMRYRPAQWAHHPKIIEHDLAGDSWEGFAAAEHLDTIAPGIVLIALPGHTRGHAAVAVNTGDRWLLHAGDAFYHHGTLDGHSRVPALVRAGETLLSYDLKKVRDNHARLAELHQRADPALSIICSHDPALYKPLKARVAADMVGNPGPQMVVLSAPERVICAAVSRPAGASLAGSADLDSRILDRLARWPSQPSGSRWWRRLATGHDEEVLVNPADLGARDAGQEGRDGRGQLLRCVQGEGRVVAPLGLGPESFGGA